MRRMISGSEGKNYGFYETCVLAGNLFTIVLSIIWFCYICYRTIIYLINRIICPMLNIRRKERNCGCNGIFANQDDLNTEDHTLRDRGIRFIGIVHCSGFIFAILLIAEFIVSVATNYDNDNPFCPFSSAVEQICIWTQMLMFYNYYIWLFYEVCCSTDLEEDKASREERNRKEIQERYEKRGSHDNTFDEFKENESMEGISGKKLAKDFGIKKDIYGDDDSEDGDDDENDDSVVAIANDNTFLLSPVNDIENDGIELNRNQNIFSRFYENIWVRDKFCFSSLSICGIECSCYVAVILVVFFMVLIPGILGQYGNGKEKGKDQSTNKAEWCWIHDFRYQIAFFYAELFFGMIMIPLLSFLMWLKYVWFCWFRIRKGRKLSETPAIRAFGIKIFVYSIVFLLWILSFIHRLAHALNNGETGYVIILAGIQELQMGSYTGVMIIAFFITNFATMYCNSVVSCGVCACWRDIGEWIKNRMKWYDTHKFINNRFRRAGFVRYFTSVFSLVFTELRRSDGEMIYIEDV